MYNVLGAFLKHLYNALVVAQTCFRVADFIEANQLTRPELKTETLFYSVQLKKNNVTLNFHTVMALATTVFSLRNQFKLYKAVKMINFS